MRDKFRVYPYSKEEAKRKNEVLKWEESFNENLKCADFIEEIIDNNFDGRNLESTSAKIVIEEFGFDRVNFVLASTLRELKNDGRFSRENKEWSKTFSIPKNMVGKINANADFRVDSHPAVLDGFINLVKKEYQALNLWNQQHCNEAISLDFEGKVMVLYPIMLKDTHKNPRDQLVYCMDGFGCSPTATGRTVYGKFISDGMRCQYGRSDFIGELKAEHIPQWVYEKLGEMGVSFESLETKENRLLEQILDTLEEQGQEDFLVLCEERPNKSTAFAINMALAVKNSQYTIYRDIDDAVDIGKRYIQEEHATLEDIIANHLDFESIGIRLAETHGKATDIGFVLNYDESPHLLYESSEIDSLLEEYTPKLNQEQGQTM